MVSQAGKGGCKPPRPTDVFENALCFRSTPFFAVLKVVKEFGALSYRPSSFLGFLLLLDFLPRKTMPTTTESQGVVPLCFGTKGRKVTGTSSLKGKSGSYAKACRCQCCFDSVVIGKITALHHIVPVTISICWEPADGHGRAALLSEEHKHTRGMSPLVIFSFSLLHRGLVIMTLPMCILALFSCL